jgi:hypothetical protein
MSECLKINDKLMAVLERRSCSIDLAKYKEYEETRLSCLAL